MSRRALFPGTARATRHARRRWLKCTVPRRTKPPRRPAVVNIVWCAPPSSISSRAGRVFMRFNSLVGRALIRIVGRRAIDTFFTALVGCYLESRETHVSEETADTGCCSSEHTSSRARNPCEV
jgi:hypothetical protein